MKNLILFLLFTSSIIFSQSTPYTLLISFDGFRWDYLDRGVSPNLEKLRKDGFSAKSLKPAYPSKTFPNHLSIITGMYPENHGIISNAFSDPCCNEWYRLGDSISKRQSKWYTGEMFWETAEKNGILTASYFWPGSSISDSNRTPNYFHLYDHQKPYVDRVKGIIEWLQLPYNKRPHFLTLYFDHTDTWGHKYGPNSEEILTSISHLDSIYSVLNSELINIGMIDSVNIIIVSDHGMTEISEERVVNIDTLLTGLDFYMEGSEPFAIIEPSKKDSVEIYKVLSNHKDAFTFYTKETIPERFHFSKHFAIRSFILVADLGWSLTQNKWQKKDENYVMSKGNHGFDNEEQDMHGIFIGKGPSFKEGIKIGTVPNINIYPMLCKIYGITPPDSIDGSLEGIEEILR